jgi:hypothetical protein
MTQERQKRRNVNYKLHLNTFYNESHFTCRPLLLLHLSNINAFLNVIYFVMNIEAKLDYMRLGWSSLLAYVEKIIRRKKYYNRHVATECLVTKMDTQKHLPLNIRWAFIKRWSIKKWSSRKRCLAAEYAKESLQGHPTLKDIWDWSIMQMHRPNILKNRTYVNIPSVQNYFCLYSIVVQELKHKNRPNPEQIAKVILFFWWITYCAAGCS